MDIIISDHKTLAYIKNEFNALFPHLKLEFYEKKYSGGHGSEERYLYDSRLKIGVVKKKAHSGYLKISGTMKTRALEQSFEDLYELHAQLFRLPGHIWLQSTSIDDWSLNEQELHAAETNTTLSYEKACPIGIKLFFNALLT